MTLNPTLSAVANRSSQAEVFLLFPIWGLFPRRCQELNKGRLHTKLCSAWLTFSSMEDVILSLGPFPCSQVRATTDQQECGEVIVWKTWAYGAKSGFRRVMRSRVNCGSFYLSSGYNLRKGMSKLRTQSKLAYLAFCKHLKNIQNRYKEQKREKKPNKGDKLMKFS